MKTPPTPSKVPTPAILQLTAAAELDIQADENGVASVLPRFRMIAYTGGPMRISGWRYPVILDLAGLAIPSQSRPIRFAHDPLSGVGHTDGIRIDQGNLVATGLISRDTSTAREVVASSKNGFPWQASIGASVDEFEFVKEGQHVIVNGRSHVGPLNVVRKSTLGEISFVDLGADGATSASVAANANPNSGESAVEDLNRPAGGTPEKTPSPSTPAPVSAVVTPPSADELRLRAAAESDRIASIRRLCNGQFAEIEARAIREGWNEQRTELELLRTMRPAAPAVHVPASTINGVVLEAACMLTAKLQEPEKCYDEQTLDLAARRYRGGIGLQELLLEAAWANGYSGRNFRDSRAVLRAAFGRSIEAQFSTIDIGGILSNVANKFLLEGFFSVERTWRNICSVRNVSDFKTVTSYRLIGKDQYEQVAPGGELKHGTLGNEQYTNKADTYGLLLSIDRRDIINDDLGAITTVPRKLGRGSGLKINDVFWTTFLNNSTFFTTGAKNYIAGATTVASIDGLTQAEQAFMDQVDSDGKPIGVMPAIMLVSTSYSAVASQLYRSMELRDTTASNKYPVSNPHQGKFRVEVSRYLANAQYAGSSAKAWYLLADPNDLPVIEVAFLNGQEPPTIETAEADFNVLGVQLRGYHDFGCSLFETRGGVKSKGEI